MLIQIPDRSPKWRARPEIRGTLHVEHLVIASELGRGALDAHVEEEGKEGGEGAGDGEGGEGFVEAADHYAGFVVPARHDAAVAEGPSEVPGEEGEAEDPENR